MNADRRRRRSHHRRRSGLARPSPPISRRAGATSRCRLNRLAHGGGRDGRRGGRGPAGGPPCSGGPGDPDACRALVDDAAAALGRLDVLVNMASVYNGGYAELDRRATGMRRSTWIFAPRSSARRRRCRTCARQQGGRVINFSDWVAASGRPRYPGYLPYYVAKAGVIALTEALALELAGDSILVNAVAPGPIVAPPGTQRRKRAPLKRRRRWDAGAGAKQIARAVMLPDRHRLRDRRDDSRRRRPAREIAATMAFRVSSARARGRLLT